MAFWKQFAPYSIGGGCSAQQLKEKMEEYYQINDMSRIADKLTETPLRLYWSGFKSYKQEVSVDIGRSRIERDKCSRAKNQNEVQFLEDLAKMKENNRIHLEDLYEKYFKPHAEKRFLPKHRIPAAQWKNGGKVILWSDDEHNPWFKAAKYVKEDRFLEECFDQYYKQSVNFFKTKREDVDKALRNRAKQRKEEFVCSSSAHSGYYNVEVFDDSVDYQYDTIYSHPDYNDYRRRSFIGASNDILSDPYLVLLSLLVLFMVCVAILMMCCISSMCAWIGCYFVAKEREKRKERMEDMECLEDDIERNE